MTAVNAPEALATPHFRNEVSAASFCTHSSRSTAPTAGFSLVEMMAAMLITVVAIIGLAHTFGLGAGFIDRYASARAALALADGQLAHVRGQVTAGNGISIAYPPADTLLSPGQPAVIRTLVEPRYDDADGSGDAADYYRVTAVVSWTQAGVADSVSLFTVLRP